MLEQYESDAYIVSLQDWKQKDVELPFLLYLIIILRLLLLLPITIHIGSRLFGKKL
jgi:hypothetical protein